MSCLGKCPQLCRSVCHASTSHEQRRCASTGFAVVTGANRGLGYEAAKILLSHNHPVLAAARTLAKGAGPMAYNHDWQVGNGRSAHVFSW